MPSMVSSPKKPKSAVYQVLEAQVKERQRRAATVPVGDSGALSTAKRRSVKGSAKRGGRTSTVLNSDEKLGGG